MRTRPSVRPLEDRLAPATFAWTADADGLWTDRANWTVTEGTSAVGFPNSVDDVAVLGPAITAPRTVTVPAGQTVVTGELRFGGDQPYTVAGPGTVGLDAAIGNPAVNVFGPAAVAAHRITAELLLAESTFFRNTSAGPLRVGGLVSGPGGVLVNDLSGTTVRFESVVPNTYTGGTLVNGGVLELTGTAVAVPGRLDVGVVPGGDVAVGPDNAVVRVQSANAIADTAALTVNAPGRLVVAAPDRVASLTVNAGGAVATTADLTVSGAFAANGTGGADVFAVSGTGNTFAGTLNGRPIGTVTVAGTAALNGSGGDDVFRLADGSSFPGLLDGGAGTDTVDYSAWTAGVQVNLGAAAVGFAAALSADQTVPPTATAAAGTALAAYDPATRTLDITVTVTGLTPAQTGLVILGQGAAGEAGPLLIDLTAAAAPVATATGFTLQARVPLPAGGEASLLGGLTHLTVNAAGARPTPALRGQLLPTAALTAVAGSATGTGGVTGIENATGGAGADGLVGGGGPNLLTGGPGNDTLAGGPGNDTLAGGDGDDRFGWTDGDNTDVIDGGAGNDLLQVSGSVTAGDTFQIGGSGGRVSLLRTNVASFGLDVGTTETLTVVGAGGDDTFTVGDTANTGTTLLNLFGLSGNDSFSVRPSAGVTAAVNGGDPAPPTTPGDSFTLVAGGATGARLASLTDATGTAGNWTFADRGPVSFTRVEAATSAGVTPASVPFVVGQGSGNAAQVRNPDGTLLNNLPAPFAAGFTGGVRVASADFNADGVLDPVVGTGPGAVTRVRVLDGKTQAELFAVQPFEAAFTGGVFVAAGDITGDGVPDLIVSPDQGGGPRIDVYSGAGFAGGAKAASFFAFQDDPNFRGGARAAVGDVNGDGRADLVVSAGFGGGPRIATFDGKSVAAGSANPARLFGDFFAFENTLRNGAFVAAGDLNADGKADLVFGGGPGGGPRVTAFNGADLLNGNKQTVLANFFGGDAANRGGVRVAVGNLDGDGRADLIVGSGEGGGSRVTGYLGKNLSPTETPATAFDVDAFPGFAGGVFVG